MLRLVHPAPKGQEKSRSRGKSPALTPTSNEQDRIYATIRNAARAYGGCDVLASVMGVPVNSVIGRQIRSYAFAVLLSRAAGIPVEQVLSGKPHDAGSCALCGRKGAR